MLSTPRWVAKQFTDYCYCAQCRREMLQKSQKFSLLARTKTSAQKLVI
ncbi:MAG: hypothetical protein RMJ56_09875 [Gemmataceae bacterium]|nr:hypothetical protein [Gemmata sp.]MDW8197898.1 hypothetical protein [Gemmataceae bacterium]